MCQMVTILTNQNWTTPKQLNNITLYSCMQDMPQPCPVKSVVETNKMIDEEATFEKYGYYSTDWAEKSNKKIVAICDDCGAVRYPKKCDYRQLCTRCVKKTDSFVEKQRADKLGKKLPEAQKRKIRDNAPRGEDHYNWKGGEVTLICKWCGEPYPQRVDKSELSSFCSTRCKAEAQSIYQTGSKRPPRTKEHMQKISASLQGIPIEEWDGFVSYGKYCNKFNYEFKEIIRERYGRECFVCGMSEECNGRKLDVHHVNYEKACLCEDFECDFVPLCVKCHRRTNFNRVFWERTITCALQYYDEYYYIGISKPLLCLNI